jgi:hypothetical protein
MRFQSVFIELHPTTFLLKFTHFFSNQPPANFTEKDNKVVKVVRCTHVPNGWRVVCIGFALCITADKTAPCEGIAAVLKQCILGHDGRKLPEETSLATSPQRTLRYGGCNARRPARREFTLGCQSKAKITVEPYRRRECALNALIFA